MKLLLILPSQKSIYSNLYEVYNDICSALIEMGVKTDLVEVRCRGRAKFPFYPIKQIELRELLTFLSLEASSKTFYVSVDDYTIVKLLSKNNTVKNMIIWAHYFYGARLIFKSYRSNRFPLTLTAKEKIISLLSAYVPGSIYLLQSTFYWKTLNRYPVFAQSIWTGLLLERVFNIPVLGNLLIPVNTNLFNFQLSNIKHGILVFLGNAMDTNLNALWLVLNSIASANMGRIDYFGEESSGTKFEMTYGIKMNYLGKISREDLIKEYSLHFLTIAPVFNGNFEMVPIQSLLSGTPVITYLQPFMELTGECIMVANINNLIEVKDKIIAWKDLNVLTREKIKSIILERMNAKRVANDLLYKLSKLEDANWK